VTSPPYDDLRTYNGYCFDFENVAKELFRVTKQGGVVVWVVGDKVNKGNKSLTSFKQAIYFQEIGFNMYDVIIYEKTGSGPPHKNRYFNTYEYMFVLSKGLPKTINLLKDKPNKWAGHSTYGNVTRREKDGSLTDKGRKVVNKMGVRTNIWKYSNGKGFSTKDEIAYQHPAIFPEKLANDHIISWSNEGDLVYDPFMGSGTTAKMSILNNRNWVGSEISSEYCKIIEERVKKAWEEKRKEKDLDAQAIGLALR
jgi:site-specific DNA-methyltransferase (adenine-specific)